ncbi:MAG: RAMP superfamily CRISPR-associated protein [Christensenellales bacterium]|jgi:CRISPR-associated protein Csx10
MKRLRLQITLTSDMLPGSGIGHGAMIDSDACFDKWGFPLIPGKRIKGMLRKAGEEAAQLGDTQCSAENLKRLFGTAVEPGLLRVRNAYLQDYQALKNFVEGNGENRHYSASDISGAYAYLRRQTAVDAEYGKAKDESLRTIRVLRKGLVFVAEMDLYEETLEDTLSSCVDNLWSLGSMRSRGLGRIHAKILSNDEGRVKEEPKPQKAQLPDVRGLHGTEACLSYCFSLKAPVIATNRCGGDTSPQIPGSTLRGCLLAAWFRTKGIKGSWISNDHKDYSEFDALFLKGDICYGPATITDEQGNDYHPLPANMLAYKSKPQNNEIHVDIAVQSTTELTKSPGKMYVRAVPDTHPQRFEYMKVTMETAYHMSTQGEGDLYQYSALQPGQRFRAYVFGPEDSLQKLAEALEKHPRMFIGRSRTAQYGEALVDAVHVCRTDNGQATPPAQDEQGVFLATLLSPAWLLDANGAPACDALAFRDALAQALDHKVMKPQAAFLRFCTLGGYNPVWKLAKPAAHCLDAGSSIKIQVKGVKELPSFIRIGENAAEGLGLVKIEGYSGREKDVSLQAKEMKNAKKSPLGQGSIHVQNLQKYLCKQDIYNRVEKAAGEIPIQKTLNPTAVHALIDGLRQAASEESFGRSIENIKDKDKRDAIQAALFDPKDAEKYQMLDAKWQESKAPYSWSAEDNMSNWALKRHWQLMRLNALKQKIRSGR